MEALSAASEKLSELVDKAFLTSPATVYPVTVDPSFKVMSGNNMKPDPFVEYHGKNGFRIFSPYFKNPYVGIPSHNYKTSTNSTKRAHENHVPFLCTKFRLTLQEVWKILE